VNLTHVYGVARLLVKQNAPAISHAAAAVGVGATAYLTAKATFKAAEKFDREEYLRNAADVSPMSNKEKVKLVWRCYIPPTVAGVGTILLIGNGHRLAANKIIAGQAALAVTERAYSEYREKILKEFGTGKEHLGEFKDRGIRDEIAQDRVNKNPPPANLVVGDTPGDVLCHEAYTGRYFISSMEKLRRAENRIVHKTNRFEYATLDDFYHEVGLKITSVSGETGWKPDRPMELLIASVLTEDGRPALSFEYNYVTTI
jgi:hypothetical protein